MSPKESENAWWRRWTLILVGCLMLMAATRWPLVPTRHLYGVDNVNFALALDDFDLARNQPPPPGDPLYVALTRWMRPFVPSVELLFPLTGVVGSAAAMAALWWVGEMLFGARAGALAALLLGLNPIFWQAGVGDCGRVYLALGATVVAGLAWKSIQPASEELAQDGSTLAYFCASAAALGMFAGFHPELGLLLLPLVSIPAWKRRAPWMHWVAAAVCGAATTLPWLLITARHSGGLGQFYRLNLDYLTMQSRQSVAGASIYWNLLGAAPWIVFVPRVWGCWRGPRAALVAWFLALWFGPPFAFCAILVALPAVCLAGAGVLTRLPKGWFRWAAPAAVLANAALFFYPNGAPFRTSNYRVAEYTMRTAEQVYARVGLLEKLGPVTVLTCGASITPREIGYYFPRVPVLNLEQATAEQGEVAISAGRVIWLDAAAPANAGCFDGMRKALGGELGSEGPVHWANLPPGLSFRVGGQGIVVVEPSKLSKPAAGERK